jgi:hypothetical protein
MSLAAHARKGGQAYEPISPLGRAAEVVAGIRRLDTAKNVTAGLPVACAKPC